MMSSKSIISSLRNLLLIGVGVASVMIPVGNKIQDVSAQNTQAVIYAPPSNVRETPNRHLQQLLKYYQELVIK